MHDSGLEQRFGFKPHLVSLKRMQTSVGRDLVNGLCLDRNERVSPLPPEIVEAFRRSIDSSTLQFYPDLSQLYPKLEGFLGVKPGSTLVGNGITESIKVMYETLTSPGDNVVCISPSYPMYQVYADMFEVKLRPLEFNPSTLELRLDDLPKLVDKKTRFVALPNPNLPIESYFGPAKIRELAEFCNERNLVLIVDEAYAFLGSESVLSMIDEFPNLIVFQTLSKAFGLAGSRFGWLVAQPALREYLAKTRSLVEMNSLSAAVASFAFDHPQYMHDYIQQESKGRKFLKEKLTAMGLRTFGAEKTNALLIFVETQARANDLIARMRTRKIYIRGGFQSLAENCVRITTGPLPQMEQFLSEFQTALAE